MMENMSRKVASYSLSLRRREESVFGMGDGDGDDISDLTVPMRCTISTSSYLESKSSEGILRASTFHIIRNDVLRLPLCKQLCPNASLAMMYPGQQITCPCHANFLHTKSIPLRLPNAACSPSPHRYPACSCRSSSPLHNKHPNLDPLSSCIPLRIRPLFHSVTHLANQIRGRYILDIARGIHLVRQHEPFVEIRTHHLRNPLALLMDPPLRPFFPLQRYYLWVRVNYLVLGLGAMRGGHAALELAKEVGDLPEHLLVGEHLVHSCGFAHAIREIGREFVETNHVAQ